MARASPTKKYAKNGAVNGTNRELPTSAIKISVASNPNRAAIAGAAIIGDDAD